ncbi:MAG TPA: glycogen debranching protein GlgX [Candidatus Eremiobacteraeota bacterium]|nr:MAG: Glycogen debranching enzyme [bacterium ADurb.Bin363]HPZ10124.1 glycogen debranching protein GlgX [Candidatus Eremiobacteraeota bacterium]
MITEKGKPYPLGAHIVNRAGVNFALFSKNATGVELLLFNFQEDTSPSYIFKLDPLNNKTGDLWHIYVHGIGHGQLYGYRVSGKYAPHKGHIFNPNKLLTDPYAKSVSGDYNWEKEEAFAYEKTSLFKEKSFSKKDNIGATVKSVVIDDSLFDWTGDKLLRYPLSDCIIYEMHVRGFTLHPSSGVNYKGTFSGVIEKIPYLKELGITTVEFMPIHDFNENENIRYNPTTGEKLKNYWGYSTLSFFAPYRWYSTNTTPGIEVTEFKEMVKELHKADIEVILDVVYNHTGEGNIEGPFCSFRGLDNKIYYMLDPYNNYRNYSGCGNTVNCNHPVVKQLILDSLRYWAAEVHIDGFRFDLATILGRDPATGAWLGRHSILNDIQKDPLLSGVKLIAEGWDAGGLYKVGEFPEEWAEWNGKYRDHIRAFLKGDSGLAGTMATRISGSSDLYQRGGRTPNHSINFITCHDGFTMRDLVSYNWKHNEENGEENRDGTDTNLSWNCGVEGETDNFQINKLRIRQVKNFVTVLMLSQGTPMILSGDEMFKTHKGNNNPYCQDNELNWLDWKELKKHKEIFRFFKEVIAFRKAHPALRRKDFFTGLEHNKDGISDITWHGIKPYRPDWSYESRSIAFMIDGRKEETGYHEDDNCIYAAVNAYWKPLEFELPYPGKEKFWYRVIDTALVSPKDILPQGKEVKIRKTSYKVQGRSVVVFIS